MVSDGLHELFNVDRKMFGFSWFLGSAVAGLLYEIDITWMTAFLLLAQLSVFLFFGSLESFFVWGK